MSDIFRFPKGYDVKILRKEDVIASINANIIDKEVALEIVKRCEIDAANYLKEGRWASIPFIGNIRIPKAKAIGESEEIKNILQDARENLERDKYLLFRKSVYTDISKKLSIERYFCYQVSRFVGKHPKLFKKLAKKHGDNYARFLCYTLSDIDATEIANYE